MLKTISFPEEKITMQCVYRNKPLLEELRQRAAFTAVADKVTRVYGPLVFPEQPEERPYLTGCLVMSMDGRLGFDKHPGSRMLIGANPLDPSGGMTDLWMVNLLRSYADAVLLGSGTLLDEPDFSGHIYDTSLQNFRKYHAHRYAPVPWNVVITRRPEQLPWHHPVLSTQEIPVLLVIPADMRETLRGCPGGLFCHQIIDGNNSLTGFQEDRESGRVDTGTVMRGGTDFRHLVVTLPADHFPDGKRLMGVLRELGIRQMSVESPYWIWQFMGAGFLDEFHLTQTGVYAGGTQIPGMKELFVPGQAPVVRLASLHLTGPSVLMSRQVFYRPGFVTDQVNNQRKEDDSC